MALAMPPPDSIGGLGSLVKKSQFTELAPLSTRWKKTMPSGAMTRMAQKNVPTETRKLNALRREWLLADWKAIFYWTERPRLSPLKRMSSNWAMRFTTIVRAKRT